MNEDPKDLKPKNPKPKKLFMTKEERKALSERRRKWYETMKEEQKARERKYHALLDKHCPDTPKTTEEAYPEPKDMPELDYVNMSGYEPEDRKYTDRKLRNRQTSKELKYARHIEICDPPKTLVSDIVDLGLTVGKEYLVLDETPSFESCGRLSESYDGLTDILYKIENDDDKQVYVSCHYFRQPMVIHHRRFDPKAAEGDKASEWFVTEQFTNDSDGPPDHPIVAEWHKFLDAYCEKREAVSREGYDRITKVITLIGEENESKTTQRKEEEASGEEGSGESPTTPEVDS